MEENSPLLAPSRFHFGVCGYCQNPGNVNSPLKRCSRCQNIFYCSGAHQKSHWKTHKSICKYLGEATVQGDLENFFSGHQNDSRAEWNKFRMNAVKTCSVILSRELSPEEQSMFLFPRVCRTCLSPVPDPGQEKMLECRGCLGVVWCSHQHRAEDEEGHKELCRDLRLARIADRYESQVKVGIPALPSHIDTEYMGTAPDITHFLETPIASSDKEIGSQELEFAFLTNHLSGPLTLLDCGHKFIEDFGKRTSLVVHIVGASIYEIIGIIKWEYLAHRLPALKDLHLVFVGPDLDPEDDTGTGEEAVVVQCEGCEKLGRRITQQTRSMTYQTFRRRQPAAEPDLVLVQNCGFHEHEVGSSGWEEGWVGLPSLLHGNKAPVIFTSYTRGEARRDMTRLQSQCEAELEVLVRCERNEMRSHRPVRDWEMDEDRDIKLRRGKFRDSLGQTQNMDLTRLPVSLGKVRSADKAEIEKDRKQFWDKLFEKYERLSEMETEEVAIDQIDQPVNVLNRAKTFSSLGRDVPGSKTFRRWVAEHGEEIDELTTIAGPLGEDEEDIEGDMDHDISSEEDEDYETSEGEIGNDQLCLEKPNQDPMFENDHFGEDESEDSDSDLCLLQSLPRQLQISQTMTPIKKNHSFIEKFRHSPKLASSFNHSVLTPRKSDLSMNLSCLSCGNQTDYSIDMGITEKQFECDECLLSVHPDCKDECKLCKKVAEEVELRWIKKRNFQEESINLTKMTEPELGNYDFSRSLSLLSSPGLRSLVSCSLCSESVSGPRPPLVSGVCGHAVCPACLEASAGSSCPVPECGVPTQPRDYTESRTLGQVAECLDNIRALLQRAAVGQDTAASASKENTPAPSPRRLRDNKAKVGTDLRKAVLSEAIQQKVPAEKKPKTAKQTDLDPTGKKVEKSTVAADRRRSLPAVKKESKTKRVRSATVDNTKASSAGSSNGIAKMEKRNNKGETPLQVACAKGDENKARQLLEDGANCNTQDNAGWTPLHDAVTGVRTNIVRVLLQFGANPSVPGGDQRLTPLHDAVTGGDSEIIRLLVSHGADRDAKDAEGRTPRNIAVGLSEETRKVIDETKVITDLNESIKVNAKAKEMLICLSNVVAKNAQVKKLCYDLLPKYNLRKPITEFTSFVSHLVVEENEKLEASSYQYLAALVTGADIVHHTWLLASAQKNKILDIDPYLVEFYKEDEEGATKTKELITSQQPKLFAGIHFYLLGQFRTKLNRDEVLSLIRLCGGKIVTREPDPEWIPEHEVSIPHHAGPDSPLAATSHVLLYQEGGKSEPLLKYNMNHIKTLPLSWMLNCLKSCSLLEPGSY